MSAMVNLFLDADDVGKVHVWFDANRDREAMFNVDFGGSISLAGRIGAAVALRDALNLAIERGEALTGGQP